MRIVLICCFIGARLLLVGMDYCFVLSCVRWCFVGDLRIGGFLFVLCFAFGFVT